MNHSDFRVGTVFWTFGGQWRCTDVGTRVIVAIRIDAVEIGSNEPSLRRTLNREQAETEGWFNGPPYAVAEIVFDEDDLEGCALEPMADA